MILFGILLLCRLSWASPAPVDHVIVQVQQQVAVDGQWAVTQVLLNGVPLSGMSREVQSTIQTMSADALPISTNQTAAMKNHTVIRSRECRLERSWLHWSDRVLYDGKDYLTLDQNDLWTANVSQALDLKALWNQDVEHTKKGRLRLQEGCVKLMRVLSLSQEQSDPGILLPSSLIPVLALLTFSGLVTISFLIFKKQGRQVPGGVIGSIVHYPHDMAEVPQEKKGCGYQTL